MRKKEALATAIAWVLMGVVVLGIIILIATIGITVGTMVINGTWHTIDKSQPLPQDFLNTKWVAQEVDMYFYVLEPEEGHELIGVKMPTYMGRVTPGILTLDGKEILIEPDFVWGNTASFYRWTDKYKLNKDGEPDPNTKAVALFKGDYTFDEYTIALTVAPNEDGRESILPEGITTITFIREDM